MCASPPTTLPSPMCALLCSASASPPSASLLTAPISSLSHARTHIHTHFPLLPASYCDCAPMLCGCLHASYCDCAPMLYGCLHASYCDCAPMLCGCLHASYCDCALMLCGCLHASCCNCAPMLCGCLHASYCDYAPMLCCPLRNLSDAYNSFSTTLLTQFNAALYFFDFSPFLVR